MQESYARHIRVPAKTARLAVVFGLLVASACGGRVDADPQEVTADAELLPAAVASVTNAMMESVTSPPVASRTYAYSSVAAYEAMRPAHPEYGSLSGRLNGLHAGPQPDPSEEYLFPVAGVSAFLTVSEALVFAPETVAAHRDSLVAALRAQGVPRRMLERSMDYGASVGRHVLAWAGGDGIKAARGMTRFSPVTEAGGWMPTEPGYMSALEPNWATLRPFILDSAEVVTTAMPAPYDMSEGNEFRRLVMEVYETGRTLTPEQAEITRFWDDNPFAVVPQGHMMSTVKKVSPGGHWMGIASIALRRRDAAPMEAANAYAHVSVALADGFISCWAQKYRTARVRPITVIHDAVDRSWQPLLQTPPFPEYTSGHSVVSAAASEVLTGLFGDDFAYEDDTEVRFGLPVRAYPSFRAAAEEAALSRLYGGIHYRDAIEDGLAEGRAIARLVLERMPEREVRSEKLEVRS